MFSELKSATKNNMHRTRIEILKQSESLLLKCSKQIKPITITLIMKATALIS